MKNHLKRYLWLVLVSVFMNGCDSNKNAIIEKPLRSVRTLTVVAPDLSPSHEFSAVVDASKKADLSFKVAGELVEFAVKQGDRVKKGQVIAKLNQRDFKIRMLDAESSYNKAKADFDRAKNLIASNTISQADFDQLRAQYNSALAKLEAAKNDLEYTTLKASFDGVVAKKYSENFQEINARQPIVALHDLTNIYLKINVPESIMIRVQRDRKPPSMSASFAEIENEFYPLEFKEIATQPDETTRTYEVTLSMLAPKNHTILPGMTATVIAEHLISEEDLTSRFYLPPQSVLKDSQGNYVFVVEDQKDGSGIIKRHSVKIGEITKLGIEVFDGIQVGEYLLTAGMSKVVSGMKVKFISKKSNAELVSPAKLVETPSVKE